MAAFWEKVRVPFEVEFVNEYSNVTGSFAEAATDPVYIESSSVEKKLWAKVNANGTEGPPPPPPPPQDEISNKQNRNFIDFILLLYKKRESKPSF